jgi:hypothetical protein
LIHASSAAITAGAIQNIEAEREFFDTVRELGWTSVGALKSLPRSSIVGQVILKDVEPSEDVEDATERDEILSSFADEDTMFFRIEGGIAIDPVPIDGKLNIWTLPAELEPLVEERVLNARDGMPAWTAPLNDGKSLRLRCFMPSDQLAAVIGAEPRTGREMFMSLLEYAKSRALYFPKTIRLDDTVGFLNPGHGSINKSNLSQAIWRELTPESQA